MAFLISFPLMFRSKVGEMKFSIPQSLLPEKQEGSKGGPSCAVPQHHRNVQKGSRPAAEKGKGTTPLQDALSRRVL